MYYDPAIPPPSIYPEKFLCTVPEMNKDLPNSTFSYKTSNNPNAHQENTINHIFIYGDFI